MEIVNKKQGKKTKQLKIDSLLKTCSTLTKRYLIKDFQLLDIKKL